MIAAPSGRPPRSWRTTLAFAALALAAPAAASHDQPDLGRADTAGVPFGFPGARTVSRGEGRPVLLVVAGVGGTPEHRERFSGWARELCAAATSLRPPVSVRVLLERVPEDSGAGDPCAAAGRSTREEIGKQIEAAGASPAEGGVLLVLIGHGSAGRDARFNLPGPDLAPTELAGMLAGVAGPVTVAHLGSASGAFLPALSAPGRVVLTASRAHETNETRFAEHFVAAFSGPDADTNKDGRLSALEVFDFARLGVERAYEREGLLRTEHPLLDDNGDGVGSLEPQAAAGSDGVLAARRGLLLRSAETVVSGEESPVLAELLAERDRLAARVDALREVRESMEEEAYLAELEDLLLQIAEIAERIAAIRGEPR